MLYRTRVMKITHKQLRQLIREVLDYEYEKDRVRDCIDPSAPMWQDFLRSLDLVGVSYVEDDPHVWFGDDSGLSVTIQHDDVMKVTPSVIRALMIQHHRKHPGYLLVTDYVPSEEWLTGVELTKDFPPAWKLSKNQSKNDVSIYLMQFQDVEEMMGCLYPLLCLIVLLCIGCRDKRHGRMVLDLKKGTANNSWAPLLARDITL